MAKEQAGFNKNYATQEKFGGTGASGVDQGGSSIGLGNSLGGSNQATDMPHEKASVDIPNPPSGGSLSGK